MNVKFAPLYKKKKKNESTFCENESYIKKLGAPCGAPNSFII